MSNHLPSSTPEPAVTVEVPRDAVQAQVRVDPARTALVVVDNTSVVVRASGRD